MNHSWTQIKLADGKCLDAEGGFKYDKTRIIPWTCHSGNNQQFRLNESNQLQSKHSNKCISLVSSKTKKCKRIYKNYNKKRCNTEYANNANRGLKRKTCKKLLKKYGTHCGYTILQKTCSRKR
jgi:hypothetical protein